MLIQCTKKLLDQLKRKPAADYEEEPLFSWHANLITLNRRKTVVLMNNQNRYMIVLYGLKAKDFAKINELVLNAIRITFLEEGIREEIVERYIQQAPDITFSKTKDRASVSKLNQSCENVYFYEELLDGDSIVQPSLSMRTSRFLTGDGLQPHSELYKDLEKFAGEPIFRFQAVQLKVKLALEHHHVFRRLIVPLRFTFAQLHELLQVAFGWKDKHLHEFYILDEQNSSTFNLKGKNPIVKIVCDEEAFNFEDDIPLKHENRTKLSDYLPKYKTLRYLYDFGDNWRHDIEIEKILHDYDKNYPVCLEGEGSTPPEDVGGEYGYEEFLKIIEDPSHPDFAHMISWGGIDRGKGFDIAMVNRMLRSRLS